MATPDPNLVNTGKFFVDPTTVTVDLNNSRKYSFVQQLGTRVSFGYAGGRYFNLNDISGGFVAAEGGSKPVANPDTTKGTIAVREWAVVVPIPNRLLKANPNEAVNLIRAAIAPAYARAFDDLATTGAGVGGQSNLSQVTNTVALGTSLQNVGGIWKDFNNGLSLLANADEELTGTVLDLRVEPVVNSAVDSQGRPLWVDVPIGPDTNSAQVQGRVLGRPATYVKKLATGTGATKVVGYMGDWSRLLWGQIGAMEFFVSDQGTYNDGTTVHSAVQENLTLFRAEALLGVQVADTAAFVKFTAGTTSASS